MSANFYSMRFAVNISFLWEKVSSHENQFVFRKRFRAVKNLCKNRSICIKDTAPTFLLVESKNPPDTAHTNSSREQLLVTKKAVGCVPIKKKEMIL